AWRIYTSVLLADLQRIVDLDTEMPHSTFEFRVPEQQLNGSEISGPPIDHRSFRTSHRMCAVCRCVQTDRIDPRPNPSNTAESKDEVTLTRGSETEIALVLDVRRRSMPLPHPSFAR